MDFSGISFAQRKQPPPTTSSQAPSLPQPRKTLAGMPFHQAKPAPDFSKPDFWKEFGLFPRDKKKPGHPAPSGPADVRNGIAGWAGSLDRQNALLCESFIKEVEAQLSTLLGSSAPDGTKIPGKLETLCRGSRATYGEEEHAMIAIAAAVDNAKRSFREARRDGFSGYDENKFTEGLSKAIFAVPGHSGPQECLESELRNGFYRAVALCLCLHASQRSLFLHLGDPARLSLLECAGIAAGLNTAEVEGSLAKNIPYSILSKRWSSSIFSFAMDSLRASALRGALRDFEVVEFLEVLFSEIDRYQEIVQTFSKAAVLLHNLKGDSSCPGHSPLYLDPSSFYQILITRMQPEGKMWENLGRLHSFVSEKISSYHPHAGGQGSAPRPRDIAYMLTNIMESIDFISENPAIKDSAMKAMQRYVMTYSSKSGAFRRVFAICMFSCREDFERHHNLFVDICENEDPITYRIAKDHHAAISLDVSSGGGPQNRLSAEEARAFDGDNPL